MSNSSKTSEKGQENFFDACNDLLGQIETDFQNLQDNIIHLEELKPLLESHQKGNSISKVIDNFRNQKSLIQRTIENLEKAKQDISDLRNQMKKDVSEKEAAFLLKIKQRHKQRESNRRQNRQG
ncbi:hypothetical protein H6G93_17665 [Nostoc sp. FACHB-973]|nr:hypothetical protein [Nostoc sp. FACHB-973]MBX9257278.1 hypothetical protein [Desmonostoc muscorum CCALA 125]